MGFLSAFEKTVAEVANRPLIPGLFKQGQPKGDTPPTKDGKK